MTGPCTGGLTFSKNLLLARCPSNPLGPRLLFTIPKSEPCFEDTAHPREREPGQSTEHRTGFEREARCGGGERDTRCHCPPGLAAAGAGTASSRRPVGSRCTALGGRRGVTLAGVPAGAMGDREAPPGWGGSSSGPSGRLSIDTGRGERSPPAWSPATRRALAVPLCAWC